MEAILLRPLFVKGYWVNPFQPTQTINNRSETVPNSNRVDVNVTIALESRLVYQYFADCLRYQADNNGWINMLPCINSIMCVGSISALFNCQISRALKITKANGTRVTPTDLFLQP